TSVTAVYTPSAADITAGSVTLTLTTNDPVGPCDAASDTVVIYFFQNPNAGKDGSAQFCFGDNDYSSVNLFSLLQGDPDSGGLWTETSSTSSGLIVGNGSNLDFTSVTAGIYTFRYNVDPLGSESVCEPADATITITIYPSPEIPNFQTSQADCLGGDGGLVFLNPGENLYYSIDGGSFIKYNGEIPLAVGEHDFIVKYGENGCSSDEFMVEIVRPQQVDVTLLWEVDQPD